jgi:endonuclease/exonuclease/phosphatase family metal-dependent hydrolase
LDLILRHFLCVLLLGFTCSLLAGSEGTDHPNSGSAAIRVLTYNVLHHHDGFLDWFDARIHGRATASERMAATLSLLENEDADLIALQEVTLKFLKVLKERFSGYHLATTLKPERGTIAEFLSPLHGLVILSKWSFTSMVIDRALMPSQLGRRMLVVTVQAEGHPLTLATCHLDSFREEHRTRTQQLHQFFKSLAAADNAILLGDFNFGDGEQPETAALRQDYRDPWLALHPEDPGLTFDVEHNPLAAINGFSHEPGRRLDRILVRAPDWQPVAIHRFGMQPVAIEKNKYYASDHYGVVLTLHLNTKISHVQ